VVSLLALVVLPAGAVTSLTVNGATSGTITMPSWAVIRCNTSAAGAWVRFVIGPDLNGNGHLDAAEPVIAVWRSVTDGGWMDEDPASGAIKVSECLFGSGSGAMVFQAVDQDGSTVGHVYSFNYTHPGQSISGTVLYDNGSPAAVIVSTALTEHISTFCFTDASGHYTLYMAAGKHAIGAFSNTEGGGVPCVPRLRWVDLASSAAVTGINFTMLRGSGPQIVGAVTEGDTSRPVPGVLMEAQEISSGQEVTGFTNIDGDYALNVSAGTWRVQTNTRWQSAGPYADPAAQEVVVSSTNVTVNIALAHLTGRIYGIVTGPGGIVVPQSGVRVEPMAGNGFECEANGQGHYEIWLPAGSYNAFARDDGQNYACLSADMVNLTVPPSHRADFSLVARPYTLSGRVVLEGKIGRASGRERV
jgi:hypothetical protein